MDKLITHWTEQTVDAYLYRIATDFVRHLEELLEANDANQAKLAQALGVTEGRISQVLNNPGNLTLKQIIRYARALGEKVSIVTYDDNDPQNQNGPIDPEVFVECWALAGKPTDFFELQSQKKSAATSSYSVLMPAGPNTYIQNLGVFSGTSDTEAINQSGSDRRTAANEFHEPDYGGTEHPANPIL